MTGDATQEGGVRGTGKDPSPPGRSPIVRPPSREGDPARRWEGEFHWSKGAAVLLAMLVPVALYGAWVSGMIDLRGSSGAPGVSGSVGGPVSDASSGAAAIDSLRGRFRRSADSLRTAIGAYRNQRSDFGGDGVSCGPLVTRFLAVDRRFAVLSSLYREELPDLGVDQLRRYEDLAGVVDSVRTSFLATKCDTTP